MEVKPIRKDEDGKVHYMLCNDLKASNHRLAFMHSQRYFIERSFQECKQQLGLNEYQVRGEDGISENWVYTFHTSTSRTYQDHVAAENQNLNRCTQRVQEN